MMNETNVQSSNFNTRWLENIYENIKKMEVHERNGREGCQSLMEYIEIPESKRSIIIQDTQYKNLRFFVTEFHLLLTDLTPILKEDKVKEFREALELITKTIEKRHLFIKEVYDVNRNIKSIQLTPLFSSTLTALGNMKVELFREIKHILYIKDDQEW